MNELLKMPDVIFLISGTILAVIALNVGITILLVRHHVQKYKDRLDRARTEAGRCSFLISMILNRSMTGKGIRKETGFFRSLHSVWRTRSGKRI